MGKKHKLACDTWSIEYSLLHTVISLPQGVVPPSSFARGPIQVKENANSAAGSRSKRIKCHPMKVYTHTYKMSPNEGVYSYVRKRGWVSLHSRLESKKICRSADMSESATMMVRHAVPESTTITVRHACLNRPQWWYATPYLNQLQLRYDTRVWINYNDGTPRRERKVIKQKMNGEKYTELPRRVNGNGSQQIHRAQIIVFLTCYFSSPWQDERLGRLGGLSTSIVTHPVINYTQ